MKNSSKALMFTVVFILIQCQLAVTQAQDITPDQFSDFCNQNFGALKDSLYNHENSTLKIDDSSIWVYPSRNSISFGWSTNLPARGVVAFGTSESALTDTLKQSTRYHYNHLVYAKNLTTSKDYYYRFVCIDEKNKTTLSSIKKVKTVEPANSILLPGTTTKVPISLTTENSTYILTGDIIAAGSAIHIKGKSITLDLNGFSITYDNVKGAAKDSVQIVREFGYYGALGNHAIMNAYNKGNIRVYNGYIIQSAGKGPIGSKPIYATTDFKEVAGLTISYDSPETHGISGVSHVHHNVIEDKGTVIINRHQGIACIQTSTTINNNLILRTRHRGIDSRNDCTINNNEIYVDSWATNSYGIFCYKNSNVDLYNNKIFGTGYMALGIGTVSSCNDIRVFQNLVHLVASTPNDRSDEYEPRSGGYAARVTWGGTNLNYYNNIFIAEASNGGMVRGIWFCPDESMKNNVYTNNIIKATMKNNKSDLRGAIVISGKEKPADSTVLFIGNTIISNFCNVLLGEDYGYGSGALFYNNTFVRLKGFKYRTIQAGFWDKRNAGTVFVNSKFIGGASYDSTTWIGTGVVDYTVASTLTVTAGSNTDVSIKNASGKIVLKANTKKEKYLTAYLPQYVAKPSGRIAETPYTVIAVRNGETEQQTVSMDSAQAISFFGELPVGIPVGIQHKTNQNSVINKEQGKPVLFNLQGKQIKVAPNKHYLAPNLLIDARAITSGKAKTNLFIE